MKPQAMAEWRGDLKTGKGSLTTESAFSTRTAIRLPRVSGHPKGEIRDRSTEKFLLSLSLKKTQESFV